MKLKVLPTERMSAKFREAAIRPSEGQLLITDFRGTQQSKDFTEPANCEGLGRIRHFRRGNGEAWPVNPLPIDPASRALDLPSGEIVRAQVFQNAVCNWRCWYCFVDFQLLAASRKHSRWVTADQLLDLYLSQADPPQVIDLTGGQPDLTPEWVPWMMDALRTRGLEQKVYLWSDDNLSNDYFWQYLSDSDRGRIASYSMYGRVCCFKGITPESFSFNTMADPSLFERQFELFEQMAELGIDLYAYVTLTTPSAFGIPRQIAEFFDRLQNIDRLLPLRTVPLEISVFSPVVARMNDQRRAALLNQHHAVRAWQHEIEHRFSSAERSTSIVDVGLWGERRKTHHKNSSPSS